MRMTDVADLSLKFACFVGGGQNFQYLANFSGHDPVRLSICVGTLFHFRYIHSSESKQLKSS